MYKWFKKKIQGDVVIWGVVILLSFISILAVYSATSSLAYRNMKGNTEFYLIKHFSLIFISFMGIWVFHYIDFRYLSNISKLGIWLSIPLLLFTWKHGANINEASRWIYLPFLNKSFQPSDLAQFTLIIYLSNLIAKKQKYIKDIKNTFLPIVTYSTIISTLIALSNLSTAIVVFITCLFLMFIGRIPLKYILIYILIGIFACLISLSFGQRGKTAVNRVKKFIKGTKSYQTEQSYIAIINGGFYGKGPGKSIQRNFLPHPYSDFIFSILIEEYGLLGAAFVILLYILFFYRCIRISSMIKNIHGILLINGLGFLLTLQALVNMSVAVGLVPVTGLTLPFMSMGGTSLLFTGFSIGIILNISNNDFKNLKKNRQNLINKIRFK